MMHFYIGCGRKQSLQAKDSVTVGLVALALVLDSNSEGAPFESRLGYGLF
jgi:hypothetical protein